MVRLPSTQSAACGPGVLGRHCSDTRTQRLAAELVRSCISVFRRRVASERNAEDAPSCVSESLHDSRNVASTRASLTQRVRRTKDLQLPPLETAFERRRWQHHLRRGSHHRRPRHWQKLHFAGWQVQFWRLSEWRWRQQFWRWKSILDPGICKTRDPPALGALAWTIPSYRPQGRSELPMGPRVEQEVSAESETAFSARSTSSCLGRGDECCGK